MRVRHLPITTALLVTLTACPRPKDDDGTQDSGADRGTETGDTAKPSVKEEPKP